MIKRYNKRPDPFSQISNGVVHDVPIDLRKALITDTAARQKWEEITPLARNEWICWIESVKTRETRQAHVERVCVELKEGKRRPCCWIGCIHRTDKSISPSVQAILRTHLKNNESVMSHPPNLLNDDGTASMATMLLMSHHAFRRDIARFIRAVGQIKAGDTSHFHVVCEEWEKSYRQALHGHHVFEDANIFPDIKSKHPELAPAIDTLTQQHQKIDPVLENGDAAFTDLTHPENAEAVLNELKTLLDEHLAFEEAQITPSLREAKEFPTPPDDNTAVMYAQGFSWSMQGIAPEVLDQVRKLLPEILLAKLPAAQAEFEARSKQVWETYTVGSATTPVPKEYSCRIE